MVRITGDDRARRRIRGFMSPAAKRRVGAALFAGGEEIQVEAQHLITEGSVSGKGHVPSLPGEPPNQDSGVLANNIETVQTGPLKVEVSSNAPYSAALEYGSKREAGTGVRSFSQKSGKYGPVRMEYGDSKTAARPFMAPAAARKRRRAAELVAAALRSKGG